jgi:hypothetical protein
LHRGGSGLAPVLSVVRGAVREPALADRQIHVFYGARTVRDICGKEELAALPGFGTRIHFDVVVSNPEPGDGWTGSTGYVHDVVKAKFGERFKDFEIYFAGPPAMAEAVQRMFMGRARALSAGSLRLLLLMSKLRLSLGCWNYDRTRGLLEGRIQPDGIELTYLNMPVEETFFRMLRHQEFDVARCRSRRTRCRSSRRSRTSSRSRSSRRASSATRAST